MFPNTLFFEFCSTVPFKQLEKLSSTYTYMAEKEILGPQAHQGRPKGAIIVRRRVCLVSLYAIKNLKNLVCTQKVRFFDIFLPPYNGL